jgi:hypothetical protein
LRARVFGEPLHGPFAFVTLASSAEEARKGNFKIVTAGAKFRYAGLRPGKYRLIAVDGRDFAGEFDDGAAIFAKAPEIEIREGDRITKKISRCSMRIEAILLLGAFRLAAQTASVEGTATDAVTGAPVPRAHVMLEGGIDGQPGRYGTTSAADGRFSIKGVGPGSYVPTAERIGFVPLQLDARRRKEQIVLKADDAKTGIEIKLTPTGTITGRVTDSDGEPVEGAFVIAEGNRDEANATTDEKGQFRLGGLAPGKYRVKASLGDMPGGRPEVRTDGTEEVHNAATYHPGKVAVLAGQESIGMDVQLVRVPFVRVSGKVVGLPAGAEEVTVMVWQGAGGTGTQIKPDGSFELWRLDPGKYTLRAEWNTAAGDHAQTAGTEVEVAGSNIDNVELRVVADSNIPGTLEFEDDQIKQLVAKELDGPRVQLESLGAEAEGSAEALALGGLFRLEKVPAGKYRVDILDGNHRLYVKSMRLGSKAIDGAVLDLSDGSGGADLSLVLSANTGSISGAAAVDGVLIILTMDHGETHIPVRAGGTYELPGLVPGTYRIGFEDDDDDAMETVEIKPGEKVTKDLKRQ